MLFPKIGKLTMYFSLCINAPNHKSENPAKQQQKGFGAFVVAGSLLFKKMYITWDIATFLRVSLSERQKRAGRKQCPTP